METIARHDGIVVDSHDGRVDVRIVQISGCASCAAHSKCGFADQKEKVVNVSTPEWEKYHAGDRVVVSVNSRRGIQAVAIAYILPAVLLLGVFIGLYCAHASELVCALSSLAAVGLYVGALYLTRKRLDSRFSFGISTFSC